MKLDHLDALQLRLSNEEERIRRCATNDEWSWRKHNASVIKKEISGEMDFLSNAVGLICEMSDDDLLAELSRMA